jgi:hypothetical protein
MRLCTLAGSTNRCADAKDVKGNYINYGRALEVADTIREYGNKVEIPVWEVEGYVRIPTIEINYERLVFPTIATKTKAVEIIETCPHCGHENTFENWDIEDRGYIAVCQKCHHQIMLCSECMRADGNEDLKCDWLGRIDKERTGFCFRGTTRGAMQLRPLKGQEVLNEWTTAIK